MSPSGPRLSSRTLRAISGVIRGDIPLASNEGVSPYRTRANIEDFFEHDLQISGPDRPGLSRSAWTEAILKACNGTADLRRVLEAAVRPEDFINSGLEPQEAADYLNQFLEMEGYQLVRAGRRYVLRSGAGVALPEAAQTAASILTDAYVLEQVGKCDAKLADGDLDGAITNARTLLEAVLGALEDELAGARGDFSGDLMKQFRHATKLMNLDTERKDIDDHLRQVLRGLSMLVGGLAPLRNKMSDAHARRRPPALHHAALAVNAAKTVVIFLVGSFEYQRRTGKLKVDGEPA